MAYNMSQEFLIANRDTMDQLLKLAETGGEAAYQFDNPRDLSDARYRINNLLYCFASWYPERAWVRKRIRTWASFGIGGKHLLHIGVPHGSMRGRKPDPIELELATPTTQTVEKVIDFPITDNDALKDMKIRVGDAARNRQRTLKITVPLPDGSHEYIRDFMLTQGYVTEDITAEPVVFTLTGI